MSSVPPATPNIFSSLSEEQITAKIISGQEHLKTKTANAIIRARVEAVSQNGKVIFSIESEKITAKSPYASEYKITIDRNNRVHMIYGDDDVLNMDLCLEIHKNLLSLLQEKYQIDFESFEESLPKFRKYLNYHWNNLGVFGIQCRETYENSTSSRQIFFMTSDLRDAYDDFYESGL